MESRELALELSCGEERSQEVKMRSWSNKDTVPSREQHKDTTRKRHWDTVVLEAAVALTMCVPCYQ